MTTHEKTIDAGTQGIAARMAWASLHWGNLHADAYPHLSEATWNAFHPTVTTGAELDALGYMAVVLDPCGTPAVCLRSGPGFCEWELVGGSSELVDSATLLDSGSSCTVLYAGSVDK